MANMENNADLPAQVIKIKDSDVARICKSLISSYTICRGKEFKLRRHTPHDTGPFSKKNKPELLQRLEQGIQYLETLQDKLYASRKCSILIILQAMDAAGKDGIIKHVMGGINPQGCSVTSFKQPSTIEKSHDFLWRCVNKLPERGMIGIFNRSYYEEVLALKVHPELLKAEGITEEANEQFWKKRYRSIAEFEHHLAQNNTHIIKLFLHISKDEQAKRFLDRLNRPDKNWKFSSADMAERQYWPEYQKAFEDMIRHTSTQHAPWTIVPADNKWYARIVVLCAIAEKLASLELSYPEVDPATAQSFPEIRLGLERELAKAEAKKKRS